MDAQVACVKQRLHTYPPQTAALSHAATPPGERGPLVMRVRITALSVGILLMPVLALAQARSPPPRIRRQATSSSRQINWSESRSYPAWRWPSFSATRTRRAVCT